MSIRYIFGMAGSGKTRACVSELLEAAQKDSGRSVIYIVPEQFSLQSERIILQNMKSASMKIQVLSFLRLSYWVLSKTGHQSRSVLDDVGKHMLLQAVLQKIEDKLTFYRSAGHLHGFLNMLARQITEFHQYGLTPDLLERRAAELSDVIAHQKNLKLKILELAFIYRSYTGLKDANLISNDETLDILADRIKGCQFLYGAEIWVDGFYGFTVQEHRALAELMQVAGQITFSFTTPSNDFIKSASLLEGPFSGIQQAILNLNKTAESHAVPAGKNRLVTAKRDIRMNDLKHLRDRFFDFPPVPIKFSDCAVRIYEAQNRIDEVRHAAASIIELTRERGFSFSDIGVASCDLEEYHKLVRTVFPQYGIPCFIDRNRDILSHPLTELVLSAIDCVIKPRRYDDVFRLFRTSLTPISRTEADKLENYVLAYGISGGRWDKPFTLGFSSGSEYDEAEINALREKAAAVFSVLDRHFKKRNAAVSDFAGGVVLALRELSVPEKLDKWISDSYEADVEKFREHRQIWGKITLVLDRMVSMLGANTIIGVRSFRELLSAGFEGTSLGLIPPGLDEVVVTDLRRSRLPDVKALLVLGVNDGAMPSSSPAGGLISGADRDTLKQNLNITLAPYGVSLTYESLLQFYLTISKPTSFLGVSYYLGGLDGKSAKPSPVIQTIKSMFPDSPVIKTPGDPLSAIAAEGPAFSYLAGKLSQIDEYGLSPFDKDVYTYFNSSEIHTGKLRRLGAAIADRGSDERRLSDKTVSEIYNRNLRTSVSRLEKYVSCPFSYFARYNLKAKERGLYELQSVDVGNVFHEVMDLFAKKLSERNIEWSTVNRDELLLIADECVAESTASAASEIFKSSGRYKSLAARIGACSRKTIEALTEHIQRGEFTFYSSEFEFKTADSGGNAIVLPVDEGFDIVIEGKIDRIDLLLQNGITYVKVIDYKSGSVHFSFSRLFFGLQLQLLLYLDAFISQLSGNGLDIRPAAALYFRIGNPSADYSDVKDKPIIDAILRQFKMEGIVLKERGVYSSLDLSQREGGGASAIVPGGLLVGKSFEYETAGFRKSPFLLTSEEFYAASAFAREKVKEIGKKIRSGDVTARPYKDKSMTACDYCEYKPVCRFDRMLDMEGFNQPYLNAKEAEEAIKRGTINYSS